MEKLDWKKELGRLYRTSANSPPQADVPAMNYPQLDGQGDPNASQDFATVVEALFAVAYTIKFAARKGAPAIDCGVMPLEGLWWAIDAPRRLRMSEQKIARIGYIPGTGKRPGHARASGHRATVGER